MSLAVVLVIVLAPSLWLSGIKKANDGRPRYWEAKACYETYIPGGYRHTIGDISFGRKLIPWPIRKIGYRVNVWPGMKNSCTGEVYNGRWWYKP